MTTNQPRLSAQQKELVAIGASVGTGCHPCLNYHLKAGATARLAGDRLLAAVTSAERVAAEAAEQLAVHARGRLGVEAAAAAAAASPLDEALASFGAALGANDLANIERHLLAAVGLGVSRAQLQEAIEVAVKVQHNAMRIHQREAERVLERSAPVAAAADQGEGEGDCGCQADDDADAAPAASQTARRPAEAAGAREAGASGQAGDPMASFTGSMAARFPSPGAGDTAGGLAAMADCCRVMFEGALATQLAAAAGVQQPSAAAGGVTADPIKEG